MSGSDSLTEALRWLRFAEEDLLTAESILNGRRLPARHVCLLSQQSAEKSLKAALVHAGVDFRRRMIWICCGTCSPIRR